MSSARPGRCARGGPKRRRAVLIQAVFIQTVLPRPALYQAVQEVVLVVLEQVLVLEQLVEEPSMISPASE